MGFIVFWVVRRWQRAWLHWGLVNSSAALHCELNYPMFVIVSLIYASRIDAIWIINLHSVVCFDLVLTSKTLFKVSQNDNSYMASKHNFNIMFHQEGFIISLDQSEILSSYTLSCHPCRPDWCVTNNGTFSIVISEAYDISNLRLMLVHVVEIIINIDNHS